MSEGVPHGVCMGLLLGVRLRWPNRHCGATWKHEEAPAQRALGGTWRSRGRAGARRARRRVWAFGASLGNRRAHARARARWPTTTLSVGGYAVGGEGRQERDRQARTATSPTTLAPRQSGTPPPLRVDVPRRRRCPRPTRHGWRRRRRRRHRVGPPAPSTARTAVTRARRVLAPAQRVADVAR